MDINKIKSVVDLNAPDSIKEELILEILSKDQNLIPNLLKILQGEREERNDLILELNLQLSRAHTGLENPELNEDGFMQKEIQEFYETGRIGIS